MSDDKKFGVGENLFTNKLYKKQKERGLTLSRINSFYEAQDIVDQFEDVESMALREMRAVRRHFNILVIGSTQAYCNRMKAMLNENNFLGVETTTSGYDALSLIRNAESKKKQYNLVISCYRVNELDGRKVYDFLQEHVSRKVGFIMIDNLEAHEIDPLKNHGILVVPGKFHEKRNMSVIFAFYINFLKVYERSHLGVV